MGVEEGTGSPCTGREGEGNRMIAEGETDRREIKDLLDDEIRLCRRCEGMNKKGETQAAPGYGSLRSPVVLVGQSLCKQSMEAQSPFFERSGLLLDDAAARTGHRKEHVFTSNLVHCHLLKNKKSLPLWIDNCREYLHRELLLVRPRLVIGLGEDAEKALRALYPDSRMLVSWSLHPPRAVGGSVLLSGVCETALLDQAATRL